MSETPSADSDAPLLSEDEFAATVAQIRETGIGLLDLLEDAKAAMLDAVPDGTFVDPRPLQEAVLAAWLEANHYRVTPPEVGQP